MLRPERMSKVSVTGSSRVIEDVIEAAHEQRRLHLTEYDGSWPGFEPGDPTGEADEAADRLVTVRSLESILGVEETDAGPRRVLDEDELDREIEELRDRVNDLDDRRSELRDERRAVEEAIEAAQPFVDLGIDLDLLSGYDELQVVVGAGDPGAVERAAVDADEIGTFELFSGDDTVAVFARPRPDAPDDALADALVGVDFAALDVPDADGSPASYLEELDAERDRLDAEIDSIEAELDEVRAESAGFLLAAEEQLSIAVAKAEAPLSFATTDRAFVAEGWVPSERYTDFAAALTEAVDGHVEVEELERAEFGADGTEKLRESVPAADDAPDGSPATSGDGTGTSAADTPAAAAEERSTADPPEQPATDGGAVVMRADDPPVVQKNPGPVRPFEVLVRAVGRPNYSELDPTVVLFLTFPAFFGFMIGDLGYGVLYTAIGYYLYSTFDSPGLKSMGGVTVLAGLFTALFGVLYGEIFGLHLITQYLWEGALGLHGPVIEKGLQPGAISWAQAWLVASLVAGLAHLNIGYVVDFVENFQLHDITHAVTESGSWLLMMNGVWVWVLSGHLVGSKPAFLFTVFDGSGAAPEATGEYAHAVVELGFNGLPPLVGIAGLGAFALGLVLLAVGEPVEVVEFLQVIVNVLSYTRLAAVLLAKAGMAFTVNLLVFGAYQHDGEFHFLLDHGPAWVVSEYGREAIMFPGLVHSGVAAVLGGLVVLLLGHALVLALGVTSAGLQTVRLEYVEFFGKFFEGGGRAYEPFGRERRYTAEE